ncbi:MAG: hypothetical protein U0587_04975 [Candidatus Binatia bacterium]
MSRNRPAERFVVAQWKQVRVHIDYHVAIEFHYYSAPHQLVHQDLDARITPTTVELFLTSVATGTGASKSASGFFPAEIVAAMSFASFSSCARFSGVSASFVIRA